MPVLLHGMAYQHETGRAVPGHHQMPAGTTREQSSKALDVAHAVAGYDPVQVGMGAGRWPST